MNWGSIISSILPTIGNVVGGLLGVDKIEDGVVEYSHAGIMGSNEDFSSVFYNEDGHYYLYNQSPKTDDTVAMTFPARGQVGAETILVQGRQSFDVTSMFKENADKDNVQFELTACSASAEKQSGGVRAQQSGVKISSSGKEIPVGGEKQSIGSFFEVKAEPQQITVLPKNGVTINSLPMVSVQSGGGTSMRVLDVEGEGDSAVVQLPQPLVKDEQVSVEVIANVSNQSIKAMLELQAHNDEFVIVDDDKARRIRNAPKLNWR